MVSTRTKIATKVDTFGANIVAILIQQNFADFCKRRLEEMDRMLSS